ncbi:MAG: AAA family ATPase [Planctomycetota bacterium]|jgi:MoxR-like ATPase
MTAPAPQTVAAAANRLRKELSSRIVGMEDVIDEVMLAVFSGSHGLLVGVPGLAKTLLVSSIAELLDLEFRRIQFTPDLMPSDIVGTEILSPDEKQGRAFRFRPGPVFSNLLLADEINRTPPKTQAALIEAMEEDQVTSGGRRYPLDRPFIVLATQNPIEQEGTYPLPAAQLDRFLVKVRVDYPDRDDEHRMVRRTTSRPPRPMDPVLSRDEVVGLAEAVRKAKAPENVTAYAVALCRGSRPDEEGAVEGIERDISYGVGPRASGALLLAAKTRAIIAGRPQAKPEDVRAVARPVLRHRLVLSFRASAEHVDPDEIVEHLIAETPAPDGWKPPVAAAAGGFWARLRG